MILKIESVQGKSDMAEGRNLVTLSSVLQSYYKQSCLYPVVPVFVCLDSGKK
jgi:hypothetical protein